MWTADECRILKDWNTRLAEHGRGDNISTELDPIDWNSKVAIHTLSTRIDSSQ
jgi:hypothetical protein